MNMRNVNIVARYESKLLRRDIVFLGFVVIVPGKEKRRDGSIPVPTVSEQ